MATHALPRGFSTDIEAHDLMSTNRAAISKLLRIENATRARLGDRVFTPQSEILANSVGTTGGLVQIPPWIAGGIEELAERVDSPFLRISVGKTTESTALYYLLEQCSSEVVGSVVAAPRRIPAAWCYREVQCTLCDAHSIRVSAKKIPLPRRAAADATSLLRLPASLDCDTPVQVIKTVEDRDLSGRVSVTIPRTSHAEQRAFGDRALWIAKEDLITL